jgi:hypothetical protein
MVARTLLRASQRTQGALPRILKNNQRVVQRMALRTMAVAVPMLHDISLQSSASGLMVVFEEDEDGT